MTEERAPVVLMAHQFRAPRTRLVISIAKGGPVSDSALALLSGRRPIRLRSRGPVSRPEEAMRSGAARAGSPSSDRSPHREYVWAFEYTRGDPEVEGRSCGLLWAIHVMDPAGMVQCQPLAGEGPAG